MIWLLAGLAFAQDVTVAVTPSGGASLELPALRVSERWQYAEGHAARVLVPLVTLARYADGESATLYGYFHANTSLGVVVELTEPDPAGGSARLARRITLEDARLLELHHTHQAGLASLESLQLVAPDVQSCDYAYPGPVETCALYTQGQVSR